MVIPGAALAELMVASLFANTFTHKRTFKFALGTTKTALLPSLPNISLIHMYFKPSLSPNRRNSLIVIHNRREEAVEAGEDEKAKIKEKYTFSFQLGPRFLGVFEE